MRGLHKQFIDECLVLRLDEVIKLLRRIEYRLASEPIPDELKDLVFDDASPNGRLI